MPILLVYSPYFLSNIGLDTEAVSSFPVDILSGTYQIKYSPEILHCILRLK